MKHVVNKQHLTPNLLFAHASTSCNTISAIQNQQKFKILQQLKSFQVQESVSCFGNVFATHDIGGKSGLQIFLKR